MAASHKLAEEMYKNTTPPNGAGPDTPDGAVSDSASAKRPDNVIDADFEEAK